MPLLKLLSNCISFFEILTYHSSYYHTLAYIVKNESASKELKGEIVWFTDISPRTFINILPDVIYSKFAVLYKLVQQAMLNEVNVAYSSSTISSARLS